MNVLLMPALESRSSAAGVIESGATEAGGTLALAIAVLIGIPAFFCGKQAAVFLLSGCVPGRGTGAAFLLRDVSCLFDFQCRGRVPAALRRGADWRGADRAGAADPARSHGGE